MGSERAVRAQAGGIKWSRRRWTLHVPDSSRVRCDNESGGERTQHVTYGTPYVMG